MTLENILTDKKNSILKKWLELIANTHPAGSGFFKNEDQFANPIGYTISTEVVTLYDELCQGQTNSEKVAQSFDKIIKITAIQESSPSQAIAFVFLLKKALKEELGQEIAEKQMPEVLLELYTKIDEMAFTAFDIFASCRERIYELRVNQVKTDRENAFRLLERLMLKHEELEDVIASSYNNGSEGPE